MVRFCEVNKLPIPKIEAVLLDDWLVGACAYYRKDSIKICLEECAFPCSEAQARNWNWPGSTVDREPYGVLCHELGHHADFHTGVKKWSYGSEYCVAVMEESGEPKLTNYCPNPAEWFAEMFRLFVTNHALLKVVRPVTWSILRRKWTPVSGDNWIRELGKGAPKRIIESNKKKASHAHR